MEPTTDTPQTLKDILLKEEPAASIGVAMTAIAQALFALLRAAGIEATKDLEDSTIALITALLMVPALTGFLIRFWVWPEESVIKAEDEAYDLGVMDGFEQKVTD